MKIEESLKKAIKDLKENKIEEPTLKARLLLAYVLKIKKEYLICHEDELIKEKNQEEYEKAIEKLIKGYPLQYITNHQEFMKLDFYVDENVLIPRADTEITVEEVISYCKKEEKKYKILDLCTGSGAIAISLAKYIPNCEITAVDISKLALEIAKKNAKENGIENITWVLSDLFFEVQGKFDIIVSNPPYIKKEVIKTLDKQVQKEPILALDGGEDGLLFYKEIIQKAPEYLEKCGAIFLEIGYDQKEEVINLIKKNNQYKEVECKKDLGRNDRMIMAKK